MAHLSEAEMINWMALYSATALCCAIAIALAIVVLAIRLWREEVWTQLRGVIAECLSERTLRASH